MIIDIRSMLLLSMAGLPLVANAAAAEVEAVRQARQAHNRAVVAVIEHDDPTPTAVVAALQAERLRELRMFRGAAAESPAGEAIMVTSETEPDPDLVAALERAERRNADLERRLERQAVEIERLEDRRGELIDERRRLQRAVDRLSRRLRSLTYLSERQQRTIDALQAE